jgi:uncharacterized protein
MIPLVAKRRPQLAELCKAFGVRKLELFGSAANDVEFDPKRSDLDFIVEFQPDFDLGPWLREYFALRDALEKLFGLPVDLVMASAITNPRFRSEADRTRQLLYAA